MIPLRDEKELKKSKKKKGMGSNPRPVLSCA
jgi:hypothetical protein